MADYGDLAYSLAGVRRQNPFDRRRQMAYGIMQQGIDASPVQHPLQGASRMAQALLGSWMANKVDQDEQAAVEKQNTTLAAAMSEPDPQKRIAMLSAANPELGARLSGQLAVEQAKIDRQTAGLQTGATQLAAGYGMPTQGGSQMATGDAGRRIAGIESGGRYDAVGPVANQQGHRAYGKFQVLEPNIGPWTQEVLGKAMTPQEFLQNPQAQEAVFRAKFGQYRQQYGSDEAASRAWFAGPGGMNNPNARDVNGTTVAGYSQKFTGQPMPQVAQGNNPQAAPGMPPAPSPQGIQGPTVAAPPAVPEVPRPQPSPQLLAKHQQILQQGGYGVGPQAVANARAAVEAELDREWNVARERSKMQFEQDTEAFKNQRGAPQKAFENAGKVRDDFNNLQPIKDYRKARTVFNAAVDAYKTDTAQSDLNMVYAFATLMDPGSVVRDQETGMIVATQTASDRVKGLVSMVTGGSRLSKEARAGLLHEMGGRYESYRKSYEEIENAVGGIADRAGLRREDVIIPTPRIEYQRPSVKQFGDKKGGAGDAPKTDGGPPPPPAGFRVIK